MKIKERSFKERLFRRFENIVNCISNHLQHIIYIYLVINAFIILFAMMRGDDFAFHLQRLDAIANEFKISGIKALPIRIYHSTMQGYGYASPLFYGDVFYYPFALLSALGLKPLYAFKIMNIAILFATYFSCKFSMEKIFGKTKDAILGVFVYLFMPGVVWSTIMGGYIGRSLAAIFVPLLIYGIYSVLYKEEKYGYVYLGIAMAAIILSQIVEAAIYTVILAIVLLFHWKEWNGEKLKKLFLAVFVCVGFVAWFVFPMLEQLLCGEFFVNSPEIAVGKKTLSQYTLPWYGWFVPRSLLKIVGQYLHIDSLSTIRAYGYGYIFLVVLFVLCFKYRKKITRNKFYLSIVFISVICILFQTKLFPHNLLQPYIGVIQFPWRVATITMFFAALICGYLWQHVKKHEVRSCILVIPLILLMLTVVSTHGVKTAVALIGKAPFYTYQYSSMNVGLGEYFPAEVYNEEYKEDMLRADFSYAVEGGWIPRCADEKVDLSIQKDGANSIVTYQKNESKNTIEFPLFMYKGYVAKDADTNEMLPVYMSENGLVSVDIQKAEGKIVVWYQGTTIQYISEAVTAIFVIVFGIIYFWKKRKTLIKR